MAKNKYNLSKDYQFDITVTDNTYAGKLALPYVTAAVKSPDTIAKGYVRTIDGLNSKAVISNLGVSDPVVAAACSFSSGNDTSLTEQVLTLTDMKVNEVSFPDENAQPAATTGSVIPIFEITALLFKPSICLTYPFATVSGLLTAAVT